MSQVISRRNGMVIGIPVTNMTSNLMQRFSLKGDNELIFDTKRKPIEKITEAAPQTDTMEQGNPDDVM